MNSRHSIFAGLYFAVQRAHGGVRPSDIRRVAAFLESDVATIRRHVSSRLRTVHGAGAPALEWLGRQPLMSKSDLRRAAAQISDSDARWRRTSGSTGQPVRFPRDPEMLRAMDAAMWAGYEWHGAVPGAANARFWGAPRRALHRLKRSLADLALHRRRLSAFEITPERSLRFLRTLRSLEPRYAYGYPTLMAHFVEHCEAQDEHGGDIGLRVVISTGELLADAVREKLARFFDCPVVNEYGCSESGVLAIECERGSLHVLPWAAYLQVDDTEDGTPGDGGSAVVTDLFGSATPLLRYELGDRIRDKPSRCDCGRHLRSVAVDVGREDSFIRLPSGRVVYDAILAYTVPEWVQRFVARQTSVDTIQARVVPTHPVHPIEVAALRQEWEDALGGEVSVHVDLVKRIEYDASGKLRYFVPLEPATS